MANKFVLDEKQVKWAYQKWCEGHSLSQIAGALFCCERTLDRAFKIRGLKRRMIPLVYDGGNK